VLTFRRELDHAAGLVGVAEGSEDLSGDSEIGMIHVLALFRFRVREGKFAELVGSHGGLLNSTLPA
jgi:hypothetical protein